MSPMTDLDRLVVASGLDGRADRLALPTLRAWQAVAVLGLALVSVLGLQAVQPHAAGADTLEPGPVQQGAELACGNLPVISQACEQLVAGSSWALGCGLSGDAECVGDVSDVVVAGAFDYFARWVAVGAIGAIDLVWVAINETTTPTIDSSTDVFRTSFAAARTLAFPLLILAALYSLIRRDANIAIKSALLYLPGSVVGMVVAGYVITAILAATDQLATAYVDDGETGVAVWLDNLGGVIAGGAGIAAPMLLVVFSLVLIAGSLSLFLVMLIRSAAILVTYAFMPLAFAALIFPATRSWIKRLVEIQLSFILAKPVIVAVLALGSQTLNEGDNALVAMMQASALFFLASFSPFALMKLLPFVGDEAVAAMDSSSPAPSRVVTATAVGVVSGARLAGFLQGSQQEGPSAVTAAASSGGLSGGGMPSGSANGSSGVLPPAPPTARDVQIDGLDGPDPSDGGGGMASGTAGPPTSGDAG